MARRLTDEQLKHENSLRLYEGIADDAERRGDHRKAQAARAVLAAKIEWDAARDAERRTFSAHNRAFERERRASHALNDAHKALDVAFGNLPAEEAPARGGEDGR